PDFSCAGRAKFPRDGLTDQIDARLDRKRDYRLLPADFVGELADPLGRHPEYVVGEPDVIGRDFVLQAAHLFGHGGSRALAVTAAERRLGAPVARVGAATRRGDVPRKVAMRADPRLAISVGVDQVPGG